MDLSASILGRSIVTYLVDRQKGTVLEIGRDSFDRASLARVAWFNFVAAANLSKVLNAELQVKDTRDVFENVHPDRLAIPRLGAISLAVLGAAFEVKKLGGSSPLESYFTKHRGSVVTFGAIKHREEKQRAELAKDARARKVTRRDRAHRIRVGRFTERSAKHGEVENS